MNDKGGYWYKNFTLLEALDITPEEQKHISTIIGVEEKYRRNNDKTKASRRNEDGLTKREQDKQDNEKRIKILLKQGLNKTQIAKEIGISRQKLYSIYGHLF